VGRAGAGLLPDRLPSLLRLLPAQVLDRGPERQARYSSVFAIAAGAFVPINFTAVRLAESVTHPRVLSQTGGSLPGDMRLTFLVSLWP
jgi:hypothetical protein